MAFASSIRVAALVNSPVYTCTPARKTSASGSNGQCTGVAGTAHHVGGDLLQDRVVPQFVRRGFLRDGERPVLGWAVIVLRVDLPELKGGAQVLGTGTWTIKDATYHAAQQVVDRPP